MKPPGRFGSVGLLRNARIEAQVAMTSIAYTNSSAAQRGAVPPFLTNRAPVPRTMASPPAATWMGRSMRTRLYERPYGMFRLLSENRKRLESGRSCQFNPPNRAAFVDWTLEFNKRRSNARENPHMGVRRLFPQERRH